MGTKVIGIDPAPKKGTTIYDPDNGGWTTVDACELPNHVARLAKSSDSLLLCWDAPLTAGQAGKDGCYYERPIERFFRVQREWTVPKGISVRAYAGCPHWAVSRASVGLPRIGTFDCDSLPFSLCAEGSAPAGVDGKYIVEVHPAVAIWLWCCRNPNPPAAWTYKKHKDVRELLWTAMKPVLNCLAPLQDPKDDDEFDAFVAYFLGKKWVDNSDVVLLGDERTGSFLIPRENDLQEAFGKFTK